MFTSCIPSDTACHLTVRFVFGASCCTLQLFLSAFSWLTTLPRFVAVVLRCILATVHALLQAVCFPRADERILHEAIRRHSDKYADRWVAKTALTPVVGGSIWVCVAKRVLLVLRLQILRLLTMLLELDYVEAALIKDLGSFLTECL